MLVPVLDLIKIIPRGPFLGNELLICQSFPKVFIGNPCIKFKLLSSQIHDDVGTGKQGIKDFRLKGMNVIYIFSLEPSNPGILKFFVYYLFLILTSQSGKRPYLLIYQHISS